MVLKRTPPKAQQTARETESPDSADLSHRMQTPESDEVCLTQLPETPTKMPTRSKIPNPPLSPPPETEAERNLIETVNRRSENINRFINTVPTLEQDGSNIIRWKTRTAEAIFAISGVSDYWKADKPKEDSRWEMVIDHCAHRVVYNTIPDDLRNLVGSITLAQDAVRELEEQFRFGGRTAQMATWRSFWTKTFDLHTTSVIEYTNKIEKMMDKLESEGIVWTRDCITGLMFQLGAPVSGDFAMEEINMALDRKYRDDPRPFSAKQIRAEMISFVTNRKTALKSENMIRAMAAHSLGDSRGRTVHNTSQSFTRSYAPQSNPIAPRTPTPAERDASEANPLPIPEGAVANVKRGEEQCFQCGNFGHFRTGCSQRSRTALHWNDWRYVRVRENSKKLYSIDVLRLKPNRRLYEGTGREKVKSTTILDDDDRHTLTVSALSRNWTAEGSESDDYETEYLLDASEHADSGSRERGHPSGSRTA
ncbi:hypothetical protein CROQUDRAFT_639093 [Cronartium quercuum f. sp. fusiforme G11]|uniref:CCHC-type domain-containing protein n=1 Tax=Cronartium quercuum f. sp. fusiforme G11 TaxID=708437 RepID=A0A9P6NE47_9BASI|nr:hypothetical protein CROQUDRAFT_639093 [Cronartium quercuum f. sp. fusiforme G11]